MRITLNGRQTEVPADWSDEPLLYVLRDHFALNGPRYGCGAGSCGACMVIVDGTASPSCTLTAASVEGAEVRTLEGLADGERLHPVQQAWIEESVPQCGYCQNGQIIAAVALLESTPEADKDDIVAAMDGVLCRCGTYPRVRQAIRRAQTAMRRAAR